MKVCALMKESVHSVETALKTNFMSCFNVRSMMRFANPFIDMHVHMKNRLITMTNSWLTIHKKMLIFTVDGKMG